VLEVDDVTPESSGVVIRRMSRDLISPIAGPPSTRRISELLPPSSLTGQKRELGCDYEGYGIMIDSPGRTNAQSVPKACTKSFAAVPPEMTTYDRFGSVPLSEAFPDSSSSSLSETLAIRGIHDVAVWLSRGEACELKLYRCMFCKDVLIGSMARVSTR
jgi:hypothetical protein